MLDGAAKISPMLASPRLSVRDARHGMTDHGNMFGASEFYNAATKVGIKPIIGVEAYGPAGSRSTTRRILWVTPARSPTTSPAAGPTPTSPWSPRTPPAFATCSN